MNECFARNFEMRHVKVLSIGIARVPEWGGDQGFYRVKFPGGDSGEL